MSYDFVRRFLGDIEAEIMRVQCIKQARLLLRIPDVFSFLALECDELLELKRQACFIVDEVHFVVRSGIRFNIEYFIDLVRSKSLIQSNSSRTNSSTVISSQLSQQSNKTLHETISTFNIEISDRESKSLVYAFIDNLLKNLNRSKNHYQYNPFVQRFSSALHVLAGTNTYEYLRINLPGAFPTVKALDKYNRHLDIRLNECQFRFGSMKKILASIGSNFIFAVSPLKHFRIDKGKKIFF